jgi:large subunit ribosomal protein L25
MASDNTRLDALPREIEGSRTNRRLRRSGRVPAVLYGGEGEPLHFSVDARELSHALRSTGAVIELAMEGQTATAVVKDQQRHPVRGEAMHIDFVRVRMDVAIQTTVTLDLQGVDDAPGTAEGGVLEQQLRELNVEALPGDVPESIEHDASTLEAGATVTVADISAPNGVTILDDPEAVVASITLPKIVLEDPDDVETETEVVGEGEDGAEGDGSEGDSEGDADAGSTGGDADGKPDTTEQ